MSKSVSQTSRRVVSKDEAAKAKGTKITAAAFRAKMSEIRKTTILLRRLESRFTASKQRKEVDGKQVKVLTIYDRNQKAVELTKHHVDFFYSQLEALINAAAGAFSHRGGRRSIKPVMATTPMLEWIKNEDFGPDFAQDGEMSTLYAAYNAATDKQSRDAAAAGMWERYLVIRNEDGNGFRPKLSKKDVLCRDAASSLFYLSGHITKMEWAANGQSTQPEVSPLAGYSTKAGPFFRMTQAFVDAFGANSTEIKVFNPSGSAGNKYLPAGSSGSTVLRELAESIKGKTADRPRKVAAKKEGKKEAKCKTPEGKEGVRMMPGMAVGRNAGDEMSVMLANTLVSLTTNKVADPTPYKEQKVKAGEKEPVISDKLAAVKAMKAEIETQTKMAHVIIEAIKATAAPRSKKASTASCKVEKKTSPRQRAAASSSAAESKRAKVEVEEEDNIASAAPSPAKSTASSAKSSPGSSKSTPKPTALRGAASTIEDEDEDQD